MSIRPTDNALARSHRSVREYIESLERKNAALEDSLTLAAGQTDGPHHLEIAPEIGDRRTLRFKNRQRVVFVVNGNRLSLYAVDNLLCIHGDHEISVSPMASNAVNIR